MDESWQTSARAQSAEKRRRPRQSLMMQAELQLAAGPPHEVRVRNLSSGGALLACRECPPVGQRVTMSLRGIGVVDGHVARVSASSIAIKFDQQIDPAAALPTPPKPKVQVYQHVANPRRPGLTFK